jgi:hypothetical protein
MGRLIHLGEIRKSEISYDLNSSKCRNDNSWWGKYDFIKGGMKSMNSHALTRSRWCCASDVACLQRRLYSIGKMGHLHPSVKTETIDRHQQIGRPQLKRALTNLTFRVPLDDAWNVLAAQEQGKHQ